MAQKKANPTQEKFIKLQEKIQKILAEQLKLGKSSDQTDVLSKLLAQMENIKGDSQAERTLITRLVNDTASLMNIVSSSNQGVADQIEELNKTQQAAVDHEKIAAEKAEKDRLETNKALWKGLNIAQMTADRIDDSVTKAHEDRANLKILNKTLVGGFGSQNKIFSRGVLGKEFKQLRKLLHDDAITTEQRKDIVDHSMEKLKESYTKMGKVWDDSFNSQAEKKINAELDALTEQKHAFQGLKKWGEKNRVAVAITKGFSEGWDTIKGWGSNILGPEFEEFSGLFKGMWGMASELWKGTEEDQERGRAERHRNHQIKVLSSIDKGIATNNAIEKTENKIDKKQNKWERNRSIFDDEKSGIMGGMMGGGFGGDGGGFATNIAGEALGSLAGEGIGAAVGMMARTTVFRTIGMAALNFLGSGIAIPLLGVAAVAVASYAGFELMKALGYEPKTPEEVEEIASEDIDVLEASLSDTGGGAKRGGIHSKLTVNALAKEGVINKSLFGNASINGFEGWQKIRSLSADKIQEIIDYDNWSNSTLKALEKIRDRKIMMDDLTSATAPPPTVAAPPETTPTEVPPTAPVPLTTLLPTSKKKVVEDSEGVTPIRRQREQLTLEPTSKKKKVEDSEGVTPIRRQQLTLEPTGKKTFVGVPEPIVSPKISSMGSGVQVGLKPTGKKKFVGEDKYFEDALQPSVSEEIDYDLLASKGIRLNKSAVGQQIERAESIKSMKLKDEMRQRKIMSEVMGEMYGDTVSYRELGGKPVQVNGQSIPVTEQMDIMDRVREKESSLPQTDFQKLNAEIAQAEAERNNKIVKQHLESAMRVEKSSKNIEKSIKEQTKEKKKQEEKKTQEIVAQASNQNTSIISNVSNTPNQPIETELLVAGLMGNNTWGLG